MGKERSTSNNHPMREQRGQVAGPLVVHDPLTLWGTVAGVVTVVEGGRLYMRGSIFGDMHVEYGGRVHVYGNISGHIRIARGAKVIVSGTILGDAINDGGRLVIDRLGDVKGKLSTVKGETHDQRPGLPTPLPPPREPRYPSDRKRPF